jgi:hypothetical protein
MKLWMCFLLLSAAAFGQNYDNIYYGANGVPTWGATDGVATMPTFGLPTAMANTPATGAVVNVTANSATDLQAKLTAATCGQKITLPAGSVYSGHFNLPALSCPNSNWVWVVTSGLASLPAEGARYSFALNGKTVYAPQFGPCYSGVTSLVGRPAFNCPGTPGTYTAQIITPDGAAPLVFQTGTSAWRFIGIEIARTSGTGFANFLTKMGAIAEGGGATNIHDIIFDRIWCHGDATTDETETCVDHSGISNVSVIDSYFNDFWCKVGGGCGDAHALLGGLNTNGVAETGYKEVNNFIEAGGENSFEGGGGGNTTGCDEERRLNVYFKPLQWNPSDPSFDGVSRQVKNLLELKNACRVLVEGNTLTQVWGGFSQTGYAILLTPKNGGTNACPTCTVHDVTVRYNQINTAGGMFQLAAVASDAGYYGLGGHGWSVHDNTADNLLFSTCNGCFTSVAPFEIAVGYTAPSSAAGLSNVTANHNTAVYASTAGTLLAAIGLSGPTIASGFNMSNVGFTNNVTLAGTTGTVNQGSGVSANCAFGVTGGAAINACYSPNTFGGNCFIANGTVTWPGTNVTSLASQSAAFVNYNNGNGGNYTLSSNACKGAATDGSDPGANIALVASVIAGNLPISTASWNIQGSATFNGTWIIK